MTNSARRGQFERGGDAVDDLTEDQLELLRDQLRESLVTLSRMMSTSASDAAPVDLDLPIGRVSRIDAIQQQSMLAANRRRAEIRIQQVKAALKKLDEDDDFGYCNLCDEAIGFARLQARPESPLCMRCQSANEKS